MAKKKPERNLGASKVWICPGHVDLANKLLARKGTSENPFAAIEGGVLDIQLDSYVLAASIGFAFQEATPEEDMPNKKEGAEIHESTVLRHDGAKRLAILVGLISHINTPEVFDTDDDGERIDSQMDELVNEVDDDKTAWADRFALLDRYAHRGFEWLDLKHEQHMNMDDLIFKAMTEIEVKEFDTSDRS